MALDRIIELLEFMKQNDLAELELEEEGFRVKLVKNPPAGAVRGPTTLVVSGGNPGVAAAPLAAGAAQAGEPPAAEPLPEGTAEITSPIVGTLYRAPAPDAEPFVEVGSQVEADTTLCIIEAMKVMNEIKAETSGVVHQILVENGQPVEYGQPIFLIEPAGGL